MPGFVTDRFANIITFSNIVFGTISLVLAFDRQFQWAALMILVAVVMDGLDGKIARRLGTVSELGKELDSLCDLVSFGVAPAMLIYLMTVSVTPLNLYGLAVAVFYICCGAYRLARFNILNISEYFVGIPITLAGVLLATLGLGLSYTDATKTIISVSSLSFMLLLAVLMVSRFKVKKI